MRPVCTPQGLALTLAPLFALAALAAPPAYARSGPRALPVRRQAASPGLPRFSHVFLIVMENLGYRQALQVPALARLAHRYAWASQYYGVSHPSLPNYLALTSGGTWGITSDCWFCYLSRPNLGSALAAAHISWAAYMEGLPWPGWLGPWWPPGGYAGKHDPFRYYLDLRRDRLLKDHLLPLTALDRQLAQGGRHLPRLVWVTPDLCHDGHDCAPDVAAAWLTRYVARITASAAWRQGGLLVVTWDEGNGADPRGVSQGQVVPTGGGGHLLTLVIAPGLPPGLQVATPLNHYSLLKTLEVAFHLPLLGATRSPRVATLAVFWQHAGRPRRAASAFGRSVREQGPSQPAPKPPGPPAA